MPQAQTFDDWLNSASDSMPDEWFHDLAPEGSPSGANDPGFTRGPAPSWTAGISSMRGIQWPAEGGANDPVNSMLSEMRGPGYEDIVKNYLQELQKPVTLPERPKMTRMEAAASVLDPQAGKAINERLDEPYRRTLQEFQLNQERQGQAANIANSLEQRDWERKRQEAKDVENQEYMWANSGYAPPGYQWKNPGAKAIYDGRVGDRAKKDIEWNQMHPAKPRPIDAYRDRQAKRKEELGKHLDSVQGGLAGILGPGLTDPNMQKRTQDAQDEYDFLNQEEEAIAGLNDQQFDRYSHFSPADRIRFVHAQITRLHPQPPGPPTNNP